MSEVESAAERSSPGQTLAAARNQLNLSVAEVSRQIKFGVKQIVAIEADDYDKLPGTTFVRGMIRSYAKLLQLDPQPLLAELGRRDVPAAAMVDLHTSEQEPFLESGRKSNRIYVLLSLAAMLAVAVVVYEWYFSPAPTGEAVAVAPKRPQGGVAQTPPSASAQPVETQPVEAQPVQPRLSAETERAGETAAQTVEPRESAMPPPDAEAANAPGGSKRIELEFDQVSWVQIKQADGKILLSRLNPAGSKQSIEGEPPFEVVIGNAPNVRLIYDDAPVDLRPYFKVDVARLTLE
jgi:cytoskeleton protein RodZ